MEQDTTTTRPSLAGLGRVGIALLLLIVGLAATAALITLVYQVAHTGNVFTGVTSLGVDLGGMSQQEAAVVIRERGEEYLSYPLTLTYGDERWELTAKDIGAYLDAAETANQAYRVGRSGSLFSDLSVQLGAVLRGYEIAPVIRYDSGPANALLQRIAQGINRPAREAQLIFHSDLSLIAVESQEGLEMDIEATRAALHQHAMLRDPSPVQLVVRTTQPLVTDVEGAYSRLSALLSGPVVFSYDSVQDSYRWSLSPADIAGMVSIGESVGADGVGRITLNPDVPKWESFLAHVASQVDREPQNARFRFYPETGTLTTTQLGKQGYKLDTQKAMQGVYDLLENPKGVVALPVSVIEPEVSEKETGRLNIHAEVISATTYFKGSSEGRVNNIKQAASRFDGVVVPPGEVFSFNQYLGEVSSETGYEQSLIIWGDRTAVGIGGGVCQVSTTAFRAALFGGFEIVERWAHGYRVKWYETGSIPGLDATVYSPQVDLKFRNDTDSYVLIQTGTDETEGTLTFTFYGSPTGRTVELSDAKLENEVKHGPAIYQEDPTLPKGEKEQVDWAVDGVDVTVTRTVKEGENVIHRDVIFSRYRPWQAVYLVGTGEDVEEKDEDKGKDKDKDEEKKETG